MAVAAIEQRLAQWQSAFSSETPDAICALYASDANLWGTLSPVRRDSVSLIRQYFEDLFLYQQRKVEVCESHVRLFDRTAICSGIYRFSWLDQDRPMITDARFSFVFTKQTDDWLIVEHHSSVLPAAA